MLAVRKDAATAMMAAVQRIFTPTEREGHEPILTTFLGELETLGRALDKQKGWANLDPTAFANELKVRMIAAATGATRVVILAQPLFDGDPLPMTEDGRLTIAVELGYHGTKPRYPEQVQLRIVALADLFAQIIRQNIEKWIRLPSLPGGDESEIETPSDRFVCEFRKKLALADFSSTDNSLPLAVLETPRKKLLGTATLGDASHASRISETELEALHERMRQRLAAMGDLTTDVFDMIFARWLQSARDATSMVKIEADDFLRLRCLMPHQGGGGRRGGFTAKQREKFAEQMQILDEIWIDMPKEEVTEFVERNGRKVPRKRTRGGSSKAVLISTRYEERVGGGADRLVWLVRPGDLFAAPLFEQGARQTAHLSLKALQYHPTNQRWEKRLARYFAVIWRIRASKASYLDPLRVSTLFDRGVCEPVDKRNPGRDKVRLERALETLQSDGVIGAWQYERGWDEAFVGQKGWTDVWLDWKVIVEPPQSILDRYAPLALARPSKAGRRLPSPSLELKNARLGQGLGQLRAAEVIDVDPRDVSRVEVGLDPSPTGARKMGRWAAQNGGKSESDRRH